MQPALPQEIVNAALEAFDAIDIIVNCAGFKEESVIQKTSDEQFLAMLNIHIVAPFRLLRAASRLSSCILPSARLQPASA